MSAITTLALLGSMAASVSAHGYVSGIVAGGTYYAGGDPNWVYQNPVTPVVGWQAKNQDLGFVAPSAYGSTDIVCHIDATPGGLEADVMPGDTVELQWNTWPESHHGPVIDYMAKCDGSCTTTDPASLNFFKVDQGGLVDGSSPPGTWASDDLMANNLTWTMTVPNVAPGSYVLRHEIIALHSAGQEDGAQSYPQCVNLKVGGSGTDSPAGKPFTEMYTSTDPGILISIYSPLDSYTIPGGPVYDGSSASQPEAEAPAASSEVAPAATSAAVSSAPVSSAPAATSEAYYAPATTSAAYTEAAPVGTGSPSAYPSMAPYSNSSAPIYAAATSAAPDYTSIATETDISYETATATATYTEAGPAATSAPSYGSGNSGYESGSDSGSAPPSYVSDSDSGSSGTEPSCNAKPSTPLPEGFTETDLLAWMQYYLSQAASGGNALSSRSVERRHPRDFARGA